jgi:hypothetical protein
VELIIDGGDRRWDTILESAPHDVFHTAGFHRFAAASEGGRARMIVLGDADRGLAWPYVLRPISGVAGLEHATGHDIGTSLGYTGPITWGVEADDPWLHSAWDTVRRHWAEEGVVSVFTRFHPLLGNAAAVDALDSPEPLPALVPAGLMVSVDCTVDDSEAMGLLPRVLRQEISAARRAGLVTRDDRDWRSLDAFVRLYRATMERNQAGEGSDISTAEVMRLRDELAGSLHLMVTTMNGEIVAAGLFSEFRGIVHAILVGIDFTSRRWSPLKVMLDDVRAWAHERGDRVLHLGGGRSGRLDSLYEFKSRFSERRHRSVIGRWVIDPVAYAALTDQRARDLRGSDRMVATADWFPAYRAPLVARPRVAVPVAEVEPLPTRVALPVMAQRAALDALITASADRS